jgi:HEPN domain-containing protein
MSEPEPADWAQWREALRWFAVAAKDLHVARSVIDDAIVREMVAFHVQQATEKVLKGLLVAAAADIRRIHDVEELAALAHQLWPDAIAVPFLLARTSAWYVATRYPGVDDLELDRDEVAAALGEAEALLEHVMRLVPAALRDESRDNLKPTSA